MSGQSSESWYIDCFRVTSRVIGRGAYSAVHWGIDSETGEPVAVKIIDRAPLLSDKAVQTRLFREISIVKQLRHPCIVAHRAVFRTRSRLYIFFELCEGGDLISEIYAAKGRLPLDRAMSVFCDVLLGLHHIHSRKVAHRDIKLENILLSKNGGAKVCDFGFATVHTRPPVDSPVFDSVLLEAGASPDVVSAGRPARGAAAGASTGGLSVAAGDAVPMSSTGTTVATVNAAANPTNAAAEGADSEEDPFARLAKEDARTKCGSPHYAAPELFDPSCTRYDAFASDMWSLGVLLYILVAGRMPFPSEDPVTKVDDPRYLVSNIRKGTFRHPDAAPQALVTLVSSLLRQNPQERPSTRQLLCYPFLVPHLAARAAEHGLLLPQLQRDTIAASQGPSVAADNPPEVGVASTTVASPTFSGTGGDSEATRGGVPSSNTSYEAARRAGRGAGPDGDHGLIRGVGASGAAGGRGAAGGVVGGIPIVSNDHAASDTPVTQKTVPTVPIDTASMSTREARDADRSFLNRAPVDGASERSSERGGRGYTSKAVYGRGVEIPSHGAHTSLASPVQTPVEPVKDGERSQSDPAAAFSAPPKEGDAASAQQSALPDTTRPPQPGAAVDASTAAPTPQPQHRSPTQRSPTQSHPHPQAHVQSQPQPQATAQVAASRPLSPSQQDADDGVAGVPPQPPTSVADAPISVAGDSADAVSSFRPSSQPPSHSPPSPPAAGASSDAAPSPRRPQIHPIRSPPVESGALGATAISSAVSSPMNVRSATGASVPRNDSAPSSPLQNSVRGDAAAAAAAMTATRGSAGTSGGTAGGAGGTPSTPLGVSPPEGTAASGTTAASSGGSGWTSSMASNPAFTSSVAASPANSPQGAAVHVMASSAAAKGGGGVMLDPLHTGASMDEGRPRRVAAHPASGPPSAQNTSTTLPPASGAGVSSAGPPLGSGLRMHSVTSSAGRLPHGHSYGAQALPSPRGAGTMARSSGIATPSGISAAGTPLGGGAVHPVLAGMSLDVSGEGDNIRSGEGSVGPAHHSFPTAHPGGQTRSSRALPHSLPQAPGGDTASPLSPVSSGSTRSPAQGVGGTVTPPLTASHVGPVMSPGLDDEYAISGGMGSGSVGALPAATTPPQTLTAEAAAAVARQATGASVPTPLRNVSGAPGLRGVRHGSSRVNSASLSGRGASSYMGGSDDVRSSGAVYRSGSIGPPLGSGASSPPPDAGGVSTPGSPHHGALPRSPTSMSPTFASAGGVGGGSGSATRASVAGSGAAAVSLPLIANTSRDMRDSPSTTPQRGGGRGL